MMKLAKRRSSLKQPFKVVLDKVKLLVGANIITYKSANNINYNNPIGA